MDTKQVINLSTYPHIKRGPFQIITDVDLHANTGGTSQTRAK